MGCFASCFHQDVPNIEDRFPKLEIAEGSDSDSDSSLKARADMATEGKLTNLLNSKEKDPKKESVPLLEGPSLLAFQNLNLSNSSSSIDMEMDQLDNILKKNLENEKKEMPKEENEETSKTFESVKIDLNDIHSSDLGE
ncbi:hypothetical protein M9Y10_046067 [Tritrichomonas musculus]|uniref:Uncharacterized protein n=1 Tax=Tritrichomonas musculus TaxID=1915356 RepID=A0ABR2JX15_9EUKA